jgi:hypothetical protein
MFFYYQCDGVSLDLANGPRLEGIAVLNIPSQVYSGFGLTDFTEPEILLKLT